MTSSRTVRSPLFSCSPIQTTALAMVGVREIALTIDSFPRSIRLAISTSPSRVSRGTVPISRRYIRTGSLVLSIALGVRSSSMSSEPSLRRSSSLFSRYFCSESTTSIPALPKAVNNSSSSSDVVMSGWEQLVHLVIEQVPLLLADLNELSYFVVLFFERQQCSSLVGRPPGPVPIRRIRTHPTVTIAVIRVSSTTFKFLLPEQVDLGQCRGCAQLLAPVDFVLHRGALTLVARAAGAPARRRPPAPARGPGHPREPSSPPPQHLDARGACRGRCPPASPPVTWRWRELARSPARRGRRRPARRLQSLGRTVCPARAPRSAPSLRS